MNIAQLISCLRTFVSGFHTDPGQRFKYKLIQGTQPRRRVERKLRLWKAGYSPFDLSLNLLFGFFFLAVYFHS
jgi:hypothetical protein